MASNTSDINWDLLWLVFALVRAELASILERVSAFEEKIAALECASGPLGEQAIQLEENWDSVRQWIEECFRHLEDPAGHPLTSYEDFLRRGMRAAALVRIAPSARSATRFELQIDGRILVVSRQIAAVVAILVDPAGRPAENGLPGFRSAGDIGQAYAALTGRALPLGSLRNAVSKLRRKLSAHQLGHLLERGPRGYRFRVQLGKQGFEAIPGQAVLFRAALGAAARRRRSRR